MLQLSERPGYNEILLDLKGILRSLTNEKDNTRVESLFASLTAFMDTVSSMPQYREFMASAQAALGRIADTPEILDNPNANAAMKDIFHNGLRILHGG